MPVSALRLPGRHRSVTNGCLTGRILVARPAPGLTLSSVQPTNGGSYTVVVTNTAGSVTSAVAVLTVLVPPAITAQPTNLSVVEGANASFSVGGVRDAPLSYQWQFNGADIAGATGTSLTLTNVQPTNGGSYTVVVTNTAGSVTSAVAVLTVLVPPSITAQPDQPERGGGANASFSVTAHPGQRRSVTSGSLTGRTSPAPPAQV